MPTKSTAKSAPKSATKPPKAADKRAAKSPAKRRSNNPDGRPKKDVSEKYKSLHVMLPPAIVDQIKQQAAQGYKSQGQVITDAMIATYGAPQA